MNKARGVNVFVYDPARSALAEPARSNACDAFLRYALKGATATGS